MSGPAESQYHGVIDGELKRLAPNADVPDPQTANINEQFRALVLSDAFPCVLGKTAVGRANYRISVYAELAAADGAARNCEDLYSFIGEFPLPDKPADFATFVAVFRTPSFSTEKDFEDGMWRHLQAMHDYDYGKHEWAPGVSSDPEDPKFSFSIGSRAFFLVSLHGAASLPSRRFGWTTLVFNAHEQFEVLRNVGVFPSIRTHIRSREVDLQGYSNMLLADHGTVSEAAQYSGRQHDGDWKCPFKPRIAAKGNESRHAD